MGELVNLRKVRKQAKRQEQAERATANRIIHGQPKALRSLQETRLEKARRDLEAHRIDTGEKA